MLNDSSNHPSISRNEFFHAAGMANNRDMVQAYITQHANDPTHAALDFQYTGSHGSYGMTPLFQAASCGNTDIVNDLLAAGANPDAKNKFDGYPIVIAAKEGHLDIVQALGNAGATKDIPEAMRSAGGVRHSEIIYYLSALRLVAVTSDDFINSASRAQGRAVVQAYITQHANDPTHAALEIQCNTYGGETALFMAASCGNTEGVNDLLAAGANPNATTRIGEYPIITAAEAGHLDIVKNLLSHGADINAADSDKNTALHGAAFHNQADMVAELLSRGANSLSANRMHLTPSRVAVKQGHTKLAASLKATEDRARKELKVLTIKRTIQQGKFQEMLDAAIKLQNQGNFYALWELAEILRNQRGQDCPVSTEEIVHAYELISENSPYRKKARTQMSKLLMELLEEKNDGLDASKTDSTERLETLLRIALEGDAKAQPIRNHIFKKLTKGSGPAELEVRGDMAQVYTLLALALKKLDSQEKMIRHLRQRLEDPATQPASPPLRVANVPGTQFALSNQRLGVEEASPYVAKRLNR